MSGAGVKHETKHEMCAVCKAQGKTSKLQLFQINLDEAVKMCSDPKCTYLPGNTGVFARPARKLMTAKKKRLLHRVSVPAPKVKTAPQVQALNAIAHKFSQVQKTLASLSVSVPTKSSPKPNSSRLPIDVRHTTRDKKPHHLSFATAPQVKQEVLQCGMSKLHTVVPPSTAATIPSNITPAQSRFTSTKLSSSLSSLSLPCVPSLNTSPSLILLSDLFVHWKNVDALCWLHVVLVLLAHCQKLSEVFELLSEQQKLCSVLYKAIQTYHEAQQLFKQKITVGHHGDTSTEKWLGQIKTGGGCSTNVDLGSKELLKNVSKAITEKADPSLFQTVSKQSNCTSIKGDQVATKLTIEIPQDVKECLVKGRDAAWDFLQPALKCVRGRNDSPVFALPQLVQENDIIRAMFETSYSWSMTCAKCGYQHVDRLQKTLLSFPVVPGDFSMAHPRFHRACLKCEEPDQMMTVQFHKLPDILAVHFVEGLPQSDITNYDFQDQTGSFKVTGVIQYQSDPDHFTAWIRNIASN